MYIIWNLPKPNSNKLLAHFMYLVTSEKVLKSLEIMNDLMVTRDMKCEIVLPASNTVSSVDLFFHQLVYKVQTTINQYQTNGIIIIYKHKIISLLR